MWLVVSAVHYSLHAFVMTDLSWAEPPFPSISLSPSPKVDCTLKAIHHLSNRGPQTSPSNLPVSDPLALHLSYTWLNPSFCQCCVFVFTALDSVADISACSLLIWQLLQAVFSCLPVQSLSFLLCTQRCCGRLSWTHTEWRLGRQLHIHTPTVCFWSFWTVGGDLQEEVQTNITQCETPGVKPRSFMLQATVPSTKLPYRPYLTFSFNCGL